MATYMHNSLLRLTIRELRTGKNELRDHFSITKIFTKPKNTHQFKYVLLRKRENTLSSPDSN